MGARENYVDLRCHLKPCMRTHGLDMAPSHGLKLVRHYRLRNSRKWYDGSQGKLRRSQIPSQTLRTHGLDMAPIKCFSGSGLPLEILLRADEEARSQLRSDLEQPSLPDTAAGTSGAFDHACSCTYACFRFWIASITRTIRIPLNGPRQLNTW